MENKLAGVVNQTVIETETLNAKMCSCGNDVANEMCSSQPHDTCRDCGGTTTERYLKILEFTQFVEFFSFNKIGENHKERKISKVVKSNCLV